MKKILVSIGLICLVAGIAILSILLVNCRGCPKGQSCRDECPNAGCPKGQSCRDESPECKACSGNLVCGPSQTCVQCTSNEQCTTSGKSQCNTENNTCVECMKDSNCAEVKKDGIHLSYCGSDSQCYACIPGSQRSGGCYNWNQFGDTNLDPSMNLDSPFGSCVVPIGDCMSGNKCALTSLQLGNTLPVHCNSPLLAIVLTQSTEDAPPIWTLNQRGSVQEEEAKKLLPKPKWLEPFPPHAALFEYSDEDDTPKKYIRSYKWGDKIDAKDIKSNQGLFIFSTKK